MNLQERKTVLEALGKLLAQPPSRWEEAAIKASQANAWFTPEAISLAAANIAKQFLSPQAIDLLIAKYGLANQQSEPKKVGIVMAGNIPLVGFHDLYCTFLSGHQGVVKLSSKDAVLMRVVVEEMVRLDARCAGFITIAERLNGCDAYIATGSNNTAGYFDYYFGKYPHIIRKARTSVAVLTGAETPEELSLLADDVFTYFGLGCRNVTKLFVPQGYAFEPLLAAFKKYNYLADHPKYKNNYDYNLAIHLLNKKYFMSTEALLVVEEEPVFSPISQLHYSFYTDADTLLNELSAMDNIQCIVGRSGIPFGEAQCPAADVFADGVDTMAFLTAL